MFVSPKISIIDDATSGSLKKLFKKVLLFWSDFGITK